LAERPDALPWARWTRQQFRDEGRALFPEFFGVGGDDE
jgi:hypothetical protein